MITIKAGPYSKEDVRYMIEIFSTGLNHCWVHRDGKFATDICTECEHKLPCKSAHSALCYLESKFYKPENPKRKFGKS